MKDKKIMIAIAKKNADYLDRIGKIEQRSRNKQGDYVISQYRKIQEEK